MANKYYRYLGSEPPPSSQYLWPFILETLQKLDGPILDVGCGNGALVEFLRRNGLACDGIEPSPYFRNHILSAEHLHAGYLSDLRHPDRWPYNVVLSVEVLAFVEDPREHLVEIRDLLPPSGILVLTSPYHGYLKNLAISLVNGWDSHLDPEWYGTQQHFFSIDSLKRLLQSCCFEVIDIHRLGRMPWFAKSMAFVCKVEKT